MKTISMLNFNLWCAILLRIILYYIQFKEVRVLWGPGTGGWGPEAGYGDRGQGVGYPKDTFFKSFLQLLTKFSFWQGDWTLGYHFMGFRHFPDFA